MRTIKKPPFDSKKVFELCVNSIGCDTDRKRINNISDEIFNKFDDYSINANNANLYLIEENNNDDNSYIYGDVLKKEIKNLYKNQMVAEKKPARKVYSQLFNLAPYNKCPFCGFSQVETLDHYLPKSKFPFFSILPINLVPSCNKCNKGKGNSVIKNKEEQTLHPYYDDVSTEQWLFAQLKEDDYLSLEFYIVVPLTFSPTLASRINAHFIAFNLANRYKIEAASRLASLQGILSEHSQHNSMEEVRTQLKHERNNEYKLHKNSWETAMFQALADSDWYCNGGFNNNVKDPTEIVLSDFLLSLSNCSYCDGKITINCPKCNGNRSTGCRKCLGLGVVESSNCPKCKGTNVEKEL